MHNENVVYIFLMMFNSDIKDRNHSVAGEQTELEFIK